MAHSFSFRPLVTPTTLLALWLVDPILDGGFPGQVGDEGKPEARVPLGVVTSSLPHIMRFPLAKMFLGSTLSLTARNIRMPVLEMVRSSQRLRILPTPW